MVVDVVVDGCVAAPAIAALPAARTTQSTVATIDLDATAFKRPLVLEDLVNALPNDRYDLGYVT